MSSGGCASFRPNPVTPSLPPDALPTDRVHGAGHKNRTQVTTNGPGSFPARYA